MPELHDRLQTQLRLKEWSNKVNLLWQPDAQHITSLLDQGYDCVIINGPWGSGKSMNLIPQINQEVARRGWYYANWDARRRETSPDKRQDNLKDILGHFPTLNSDQTGVLILDETGDFENEASFREFLEGFEKSGYRKSVLIPAGGEELRGDDVIDKRSEMINFIQKSFADQGKSTITYKLEKRTLPEELAREYFSILETPKDVIDFIIVNFPSYPYVIDMLKHLKSIDQVKEWWNTSHSYFRVYQRGLSKNEVDDIDRKMGKKD